MIPYEPTIEESMKTVNFIKKQIDETDGPYEEKQPDGSIVVTETGPNPALNIVSLPRSVRRQRKLLGKKIIKLTMKGNDPRKIARKLGSINIRQGEQDVRGFISAYLNQ